MLRLALGGAFFAVGAVVVVNLLSRRRRWEEDVVIIRGALDIGSGEHKLVIAEMVRREGAQLVVKRVLHSEVVGVPLAIDLRRAGNDGTLSAGALAASDAALASFAATARSLGAQEVAGIATAVFRRAKNGEEHLARMETKHGLRLTVVTQEMEGRLGFLTAAALTGDPSCLSWDSGGGSFQLATTGEAAVKVFEGPIGNADVHATLRDLECDAASLVASVTSVVPDAPQWLRTKLAKLAKTQKVVAFGARSSLFRLAADIIGDDTLTLTACQTALETVAQRQQSGQRAVQTWLDARAASAAQRLPFAPLSPGPYPEIHLVLPKLALLVGVMLKLKIDTVQYYEANGSCLGVLLLEGDDIDIWQHASDS